MPSVRIEFTVPEDVAAQIDAARGEIPRAAWIKALIARELPQRRRLTSTEAMRSAQIAGELERSEHRDMAIASRQGKLNAAKYGGKS